MISETDEPATAVNPDAPKSTTYQTDRQVLEEIASMTLWGEAVKDKALIPELIEAGEYDEDEGVYNPSADSECNMLRDAVETARDAIERDDVTALLLAALKLARQQMTQTGVIFMPTVTQEIDDAIDRAEGRP